MVRHIVTWFGATLLCLAISAPVLGQDEQPATEEAAQPQAAPPPAAATVAMASAPPAAECSNTCPTSPSPIDQDDDSTGWLIIGIGGSVAATTLALGISMAAQAGTNAESRLGSASIAGGITGVALSLLVGLIAM